MVVVTTILVTFVVWVFAVIAVVFGGAYLAATVGRPKPAAPPAPARNVSGPPPAAAAPKPAAPKPAAPDYIPRWDRARVLREWQDLASFQRLLDS